MESVFQVIFSSVFFILIVLGMTLNGFIVLMNFQTWMKKRCLPSGDKIITSLCLSRWIFQCLVAVHYVVQLFTHGTLHVFFTPARILMNYISIWFASLLCVYYCVKISNYNHSVFLFLKLRMAKLVPWCLALCVFLSLAFIQPYAWHFFQNGGVLNTTKKRTLQSYPYAIGSSPPFLIFAVAFFLTVPSLWRHIRTMSGEGTSFRSPDMKTHYNAIKSMAAFFLLHIFFIIVVNVNLSGALQVGVLYNSLTGMLVSFYPFLHPAVIIFYNRNLRQGFLGLLTCDHSRGDSSSVPPVP